MSLHDHAAAADFIGNAIANRAEQMGDPTGLLRCLADAYNEAASMIRVSIIADAQSIATGCTLNHAAMPPGKCLACGARTPA